MNQTLLTTLRMATICAALLWLYTSCGGPGYWGSPQDKCDPAAEPKISQHPLWNKTFGSTDATANACLRISWGDKDNQSKGFFVQITKDGQLKAYDKAKGSFDAEVNLELPTNAKDLPRRFRLFVFADNFSALPSAQEGLCTGRMAKPSYQCQNVVNDCWFALAFRPKAPEGTQASPEIPGAAGARCKLITNPTFHTEPNSEAGSDATPEPTADDVDDAGQEVPVTPETKPDDGCTSRTRPCYTGAQGCSKDGTFTCIGQCKAGTQTCNNGVWGKCQGELGPDPETCNQKDSDCNGKVDDAPGGCDAECKAPCVTTVAGSGNQGSADGKGTGATMREPLGLALYKGDIYFADAGNHKIRVLRANGAVETIAGSGMQGHKNGAALAAQFSRPSDIAVDATGNLYVADTENHEIRKIDTSGQVTTFAGKVGNPGFDGTSTTNATFNFPSALAIGPKGDLYIADTDNHAIRKIDMKTKQVFSLAGSGKASYTDGRGTLAEFDAPRGIVVDNNGLIYIADTENHVIRALTQAGDATTVAGLGKVSGHKDGAAKTEALFHKPSALAIDPAGDIFVVDTFNQRIRKIQLGKQEVSTVAGVRTAGSKDGEALKASFNFPKGIVFVKDAKRFIIADTTNHKLRAFLYSTAFIP